MKVFVASPAQFKISIFPRDKTDLIFQPEDSIDVTCLTGTFQNAFIHILSLGRLARKYLCSESECMELY